jgi:hypothetical protein
MVNTLSLGIRLVIVLPTFLFIVSQILRYGLKARTKKELSDQRGQQPGWIFSRLVDLQSSREFKWEFFIDAVILSLVNGLILIFELSRIEYGVILLLVGVILGLAGLVETEANSGAVGLLAALVVLLFLSELIYFASFGTSLIVMGFTVEPRHLFFAPWIAFLILMVTTVRRKK